MWSATSAVVCALSLMHGASQTLRPITLLEVQPTATEAMPRVRSDSPVIVELIRQATERSTTFKGLVATIDHTDGIVYVVLGACGHGVRACLVLTVAATGPYR